MDNQRIISCETPAHDHVERCGYLFGWPINHSMSPLMHRTIFGEIGYNWEQFFLPSTDMSMFLSLVRETKFFGALSILQKSMLECLNTLEDEHGLTYR